ncbi:MAG: hypothetical protein V4647_03160 [Pseudomonadota bacterium]
MECKHSIVDAEVELIGDLPQVRLMSPEDYTSADLDRLDWAGSLVFGGYGARVGARFGDCALGVELALRPMLGTRQAGPGKVDRMLSVFHRDGRYWIFGDGELKCQPVLRADLLDAFDTHLRATFAEFSRRKLFVHSGVVGWNGKAIMVPGQSRAGKSTLIAELVQAGATYFSDEYAVLDNKGRVHPFAKPLSLRDPITSRQRRMPVESFGGIAARHPLPVGLVLLTQYCAGAKWQPVVMPAGEGALAIMANTIAARRWPALALSVIGTVAQRAPFIRSDRGEAREVARLILAGASLD